MQSHSQSCSHSDYTYHSKMMHLVFRSGLNPVIVNRYVETFDKHFSDVKQVAGYSEADCQRIHEDPEMLHNMSKINACVHNAKKFNEISEIFGSFENYLMALKDEYLPDNAEMFAKRLSEHFKYIRPVNAYAFLHEVFGDEVGGIAESEKINRG